MYAKVKIGEREIPMMAMASTDFYYKNTFGEDLLTLMTQPDLETSKTFEIVAKMGFIMAKFAELKKRKDMLKLNEEAFIEWLDQFDREDFFNEDTLLDIQNVYAGNKETSSEIKNQEDQ